MAGLVAEAVSAVDPATELYTREGDRASVSRATLHLSRITS